MAASTTGAANGRRKLIVVSNRGPIVYGRDDDGNQVARRGAGGLVTALAPLVSHHDVTWIASAISPEDREVAQTGPQQETAADGSRYRLRLVAHLAVSYDLFYNVVANPVLWFLQHGLWEHLRQPGRRPRPRVGRGLRGRQPPVRGRRPRGARARAGGGCLLPRLPPLPRAPVRPREEAGGRPGALHARSLGRARGLVGSPARDRAGDSRRTACERRRRLPYRALAERLSLRLCRVGPRLERVARDLPPDLDRPGRLRGAGGERRRPRAGARAALVTAGVADRARRSHRPVEERRSRARGLRAPARAPARPARSHRHARPPRPVASGDSGVRRRARADQGRSGGGRGALPGLAGAGDRRRLSSLDRRLQAVRRPARELGHGRSQPRREGGAAREHA